MKRSGLFLAGVLMLFFAVSCSEQPELKSVRGLIERIAPGYGSQFKLELIPAEDGLDTYEIDSKGRRVVLRGNNPVALATAFNQYLKYTCDAHVSWFGDQLDLPKRLPAPRTPVHNTINGKYRVCFNYCTLSYTAAWWDWKRWQREIDYMAMNSINMPLMSVGLEAVWYNTLEKHGFSDEEIRGFLAGPGHSAWQWMQNLQSYGGPLPMSWIESHKTLARQILARELEFGMMPIQQGFSGYVPRELKDKYPDAKIKLQGPWCGFTGAAQLDPSDPLFKTIGRDFLEEEKALYGAYGHYAADPFHESAPPVDTPEYMHDVGETINGIFQEFDPGCTWVMMAWSMREQIVTAVPKEDLLILDLGGDTPNTNQAWGYPVVLGNLHNFGGRINLHGDLEALASNNYVKQSRRLDNVVGSGLFMEAIEQNQVFYDLAFELPVHKDSVDLSQWLCRYADRRYGFKSEAAHEAWQLLLEGPYTKGTSGTENSSIIAARPALGVKKSGPNAGFYIPYDPEILVKAQELLLQDSEQMKESAPYRFDLVDVQRQILSNLGQKIHKKAAQAFMDGDKDAFKLHSGRFLELLDDADRLLGTRPEFNFYRWIDAARSWGTDESEKNLFEKDATSLVTIWGADGDPEIFDYSWREWAGLIGDFYAVRWRKFYAMLQQHLDEGTPYVEDGLPQVYGRETFRANDFYSALGDWELQFVGTYGKTRTPVAQGDDLETVRELFEKYVNISEDYKTVIL